MAGILFASGGMALSCHALGLLFTTAGVFRTDGLENTIWCGFCCPQIINLRLRNAVL